LVVELQDRVLERGHLGPLLRFLLGLALEGDLRCDGPGLGLLDLVDAALDLVLELDRDRLLGEHGAGPDQQAGHRGQRHITLHNAVSLCEARPVWQDAAAPDASPLEGTPAPIGWIQARLYFSPSGRPSLVCHDAPTSERSCSSVPAPSSSARRANLTTAVPIR